jgi:glucose/arabinose dehydrogenase
VNERDGLGDTLVPDYLTHLEPGGFYGWPYGYFGNHLDQRVEPPRPDLVKRSLTPDFALGAHTASLGLDFYHQKVFPTRYHQGAFIGQHGSWNRSQLVGYQVAFVPFTQGQPSGDLEPFLTGFIADQKKGTVYGRPVGVTALKDGSLLVADDAGNRVWHVRTLPWS